jgi:hypothetical protein
MTKNRIAAAAEDTSDDVGEFDPAVLETPAVAPSLNGDGDKFSPEYLGLNQDFESVANVIRKIDIIKVEKPSPSRVFRVHPEFALKTILLMLKEDNETYLIAPSMRQALAGESLIGVFTLFACISKAGTPFIWPIRMADTNGKWNVWHQSGYMIAEKARVRWTRMQANRDAGCNQAEFDARSVDQQQEANWPDMPFKDWLRLAFQGFTIDSLEHPVLKKLRMED